tara:strand:- start:493 stop:927 length:435 start_codon:yes stop_codon:yes gene_type:complete
MSREIEIVSTVSGKDDIKRARAAVVDYLIEPYIPKQLLYGVWILWNHEWLFFDVRGKEVDRWVYQCLKISAHALVVNKYGPVAYFEGVTPDYWEKPIPEPIATVLYKASKARFFRPQRKTWLKYVPPVPDPESLKNNIIPTPEP